MANNKKIETIAINAVKDSIIDCDVLDEFISDNDKEPSWDGHIYIYKNIVHKKGNIEGRVPAQVKGKLNDDFSKKTITYPVSIDDLDNYKRDGGVMFFIVYIKRYDRSQRRIYYASLSPVKINEYLEDKEKRKSINITFKEFPSESNLKTTIIINFYQNCIKQKSFVEAGFISLENLQKKEFPFTYTIPIHGYGIDPTAKILFSSLYKNELYLYIKREDLNTLIPTDIVISKIETVEKVKMNITVDKHCFYNEVERRYGDGQIKLKIGDSVILSIDPQNLSCETEIKFSSFVRKWVKDMEFVLQALKKGEFNIGEVKLGLKEENIDSFDIKKNEKNLHTYKNIVRLLDILNVTEDLDLDGIKSHQLQYLNYLLLNFIYKKPLQGLSVEKDSIWDLRISNLLFKLIVIKKEDGKFDLEDFFKTTATISCLENGTKRILIPPFSALTKDDYLKISNIPYGDIANSYKNLLSDENYIFYRANNDMLLMLKVYDESKNTLLLNEIKKLCDWIYIECDKIEEPIKKLNQLQIAKRVRELNEDELEYLWRIVEDINSGDMEKIGAYLLIEDQIMARRYFKKLSKQDQDHFREFPIFFFSKF